MKQLRKTASFSLTELVVVVTILAAIAIISIPNYLKYVKSVSLTEAISVMSGYKTALVVMWATQSKVPTTGDVLASSPVSLPFGTVVTANLPGSIESMLLTNSGNGTLIQIVIQADVFSSYPSNNRQLALGAKIVGSELVFQCGNLSENATSVVDIGFIDESILPKGCNYNGIATWLAT